MKDERKIGVILNYLNIALRVFSQFWVTRILLGTLGQAEYGLVGMSSSVLIILPLLDFGMTATIIRYAAEYRAKNDLNGLRDFLGLCQKFFYCIAFLAALSCTVIYFYLPDIFVDRTADELYKIKVMFIMLSCGSVINFTVCLYTSVLTAFQKFFFTNILTTFSLLLTAGGSIVFVLNGFGAIGVTAAGLIFHLISIFPARLYCWNKLKLKPNLRFWDWELMKKKLPLFHLDICWYCVRHGGRKCYAVNTGCGMWPQ